jgi:phosphoribosylanthranilate isomerase
VPPQYEPGRRLWVKVCGFTRVDQALAAAAAGIDAVGLVFAPSPRRISPRQAALISRALPPVVARVGVFVDSEEKAILHIAEVAGLTMVQLHGDEPPEQVAALARAGLPVIKAVQSLSLAGSDLAARYLASGAFRLLADAGTTAQRGGTGRLCDWQTARMLAKKAPLILAGGLRPANVATAVQTVKPWGIDVCSGVEYAPGDKDPALVARLVAQARQLEVNRYDQAQ